MSIKRQTLWSLAQLLATSAAACLSLPKFLKCLGDEIYALWSHITTFYGIFGLADLGLVVVAWLLRDRCAKTALILAGSPACR